MAIRNTENSYGSIAKFLHWAIALLIITMLSFGFFLEGLSKEIKPTAYSYHKVTGLVILFLMLMRVFWILVNPKPKLPADTLKWQRVADHIVQGMLYLSAIAMPLVGWLGACYAGHPPQIGSVVLNIPVAPDKAMVELFFTLHKWIAFSLIFFIGIHIAAALFHYFIRKDFILQRMLP